MIIVKLKGMEEKSQCITITGDTFKEVVDYPDGSQNQFLKLIMTPLKEELIRKYVGSEVYGKYIGNSRTDGYPLFKLDLRSLERDDKINKILN